MAFFTEETDNTKGSHHDNQIAALLCMHKAVGGNHDLRQFEVDEIARGINLDEKETQRTMYVLEGMKLVQPCPPGDFTTRFWRISEEGCSLAITIIKTQEETAKQQKAYAA